MFKPKTKSRLKRTLSGALALAMTASLAAVMPAAAEETAKYPYAIFAADEAAGISVNDWWKMISVFLKICLTMISDQSKKIWESTVSARFPIIRPSIKRI